MIDNIQKPLVMDLRDATEFLHRRGRMCKDRVGRGEMRFVSLLASDIRLPDEWRLLPYEGGDGVQRVLGLDVSFGGGEGTLLLPTKHATGQIFRAMNLDGSIVLAVNARKGYRGLLSYLNDRMGKVNSKANGGKFLFRMLEVPGLRIGGGDSCLVLRALLPRAFSTDMDNFYLCCALDEVIGKTRAISDLQCFLNSGDTMQIKGWFVMKDGRAMRSDEERAPNFLLQASEVGHRRDIVVDVLVPPSKQRTLISYQSAISMHKREALRNLMVNAVVVGRDNILNAVREREMPKGIVNITIKRKGVSER